MLRKKMLARFITGLAFAFHSFACICGRSVGRDIRRKDRCDGYPLMTESLISSLKGAQHASAGLMR